MNDNSNHQQRRYYCNMLSIADRLKGLLISKKNAENNSISSFPSIMKTVLLVLVYSL
jgi:hypothetical protein